MLQIAIIEDEKNTSDLLKKYLDDYSKKKQIELQAYVYSCAEDLLQNYTGKYDLLLMDIQLPGISGMDAVHKIRENDHSICVIFITSLAQYAVKGYEVEALDFIVKPVGYQQFIMKLERAVTVIQRNEDYLLRIPQEHGIKVIPSRDILYLEILNHDLIYHTKDGSYRTRGSLRNAEEVLSKYGFIRISVCYLVNMKYINEISGYTFVLITGEKLIISRSRKKQVMSALAEYLGGSN